VSPEGSTPDVVHELDAALGGLRHDRYGWYGAIGRDLLLHALAADPPVDPLTYRVLRYVDAAPGEAVRVRHIGELLLCDRARGQSNRAPPRRPGSAHAPGVAGRRPAASARPDRRRHNAVGPGQELAPYPARPSGGRLGARRGGGLGRVAPPAATRQRSSPALRRPSTTCKHRLSAKRPGRHTGKPAHRTFIDEEVNDDNDRGQQQRSPRSLDARDVPANLHVRSRPAAGRGELSGC